MQEIGLLRHQLSRLSVVNQSIRAKFVHGVSPEGAGVACPTNDLEGNFGHRDVHGFGNHVVGQLLFKAERADFRGVVAR